MTQRLAILASGTGTNMNALAAACTAGELPARVVVVGSNVPQAGVLRSAQQRDLPTFCLDHRRFDSREAFDLALIEALQRYTPDWVLLAGFMRILSAPFIRQYRGRLLNIHPSLLPKFPGLNTHQRALDAGDKEAGASVHFVSEAVDGGPVILQARVPIAPGDDAAALAARVLQVEHRLYPEAVRWCLQGRVRLDGERALLDGKPLPEQGMDHEITCATH
jgi:phosphoribosylglycinamide formyltransferase-1